MRYKKLGIVLKQQYPMWEFNFDYSLLLEPVTEVFVAVKPKRRLTSVPADAAALPVAEAQAQSEPTVVTGGTAEHHR